MTPERLLLKEKPQELELAFDVSSYWGFVEEEIKTRLVEDLPSYVIEQGNLPDREKTTYSLWHVKKGEVIHPTLGPVINHIGKETLRGRQEYKAFLKIREYLIEKNPGTIVCWFSPRTSEEEKSGYRESRVALYYIDGFLDEEKSEKVVKVLEYTGRYSFEEIRQIANQFRAYSEEEYFFPNLVKLRETPICLQVATLKEIVEGVAVYPEAWEDIVSGEVTARMERVKKAAVPVANQVVEEIEKRTDPILVGARIEREMERRISWSISYLGGCGFSNGALLQMRGVESYPNYLNLYYVSLKTDEDEVTVLETKKEKKFFGKCPICGYVIPEEKAISAGQRCPGCGNIYEGC